MPFTIRLLAFWAASSSFAAGIMSAKAGIHGEYIGAMARRHSGVTHIKLPPCGEGRGGGMRPAYHACDLYLHFYHPYARKCEPC